MKRATARAAAGCAAAIVVACTAVAQPESPPAGAARRAPSDQAVTVYLEQLGLQRLQAEDLSRRIVGATGTERVQMAERLGRLYVRLLGEQSSPQERKAWEERSRELLRTIPEADTYELRLALNKALYLQAEDVIERHRLRLATPDEVAEADVALRALKPQLEEIGARANRKVEQLKVLEEKGELTERQYEELADAQRARSESYYFGGWSAYYLAMLSRADDPASDAMRDFGWLLNSSGSRIASIERLPKELLKYEHIARAAIGCGLCTALRGNETLGLRWLDEVEFAEDVSPAVRAQLLPRRITILSDAKRWADLERLIRVQRKSDRAGGGDSIERLPPSAARLLAVVTLEADKSISRDLIEPLSAIALGDLVAQGELGQVLDLVKRYGTAPIGDKGFIVFHVRGLQRYDEARAAHASEPLESDDSSAAASAAILPATDKPARLEATIKAYGEAAVLLEGALTQPDVDSFRVERAQASMFAGLAWYYAGSMAKAADRFQATAGLATDKKQAGEALWLAVVALDQAVEAGDESLAARRDEAATLFLQSDPDSERAARLIVRRAMTGGLDTEESIKILVGVAPESPMYILSRQHAARLLYKQYRAATGTDRDFAAMRFVGVAEETLVHDRRAAMEGDQALGREAAERIVTRVRQILDAVLSVASPDVRRAEAALESLLLVAEAFTLDLSAYESEMTFRRFQIALAKDEPSVAAALGEQLRAEGGTYSLAADQHLFRRALGRFQRATEPGTERSEAAREVVRVGQALIGRVQSPEAALNDASIRSLYQNVSRAAYDLFQSTSDSAMRDLSLSLDTSLLSKVPSAEEPLRRVARTSESAGDNAKALDCWRTLMSGLSPGSAAWFEARYESLRLLVLIDPARAKQVLQQHVVLYPAYGPEPWGAKIKQVEAQLNAMPGPLPPVPGGDSGSAPAPQGGKR